MKQQSKYVSQRDRELKECTFKPTLLDKYKYNIEIIECHTPQ